MFSLLHLIKRQISFRCDHCCFAWDLISGLIVTLIVGFTVLFLSLIVNIGQIKILFNDFSKDMYPVLIDAEPVHYTCTFIYLILALISFVVLFYGALKEQNIYLVIGWLLLDIGFLFWVMLTMLSYNEKFFRYVCISSRCPDTHWFMESGWRALTIKLDCRDPFAKKKHWGFQLEVSHPPFGDTYDKWFPKYDLTKIQNTYSDVERSKARYRIPDKSVGYLINAMNKSKINVTEYYRSVLVNIRENSNTTEDYFKKVKQFVRYINETSKIKFLNLKAAVEYGDNAVEYEDVTDKARPDVPEEEGVVHDILEHVPRILLNYYMDPVLSTYSKILAICWGVFILHTNIVLIMFYMEKKRKLKEYRAG